MLSRIATALLAAVFACLLIVCVAVGCVVSMFNGEDEGPWYTP